MALNTFFISLIFANSEPIESRYRSEANQIITLTLNDSTA